MSACSTTAPGVAAGARGVGEPVEQPINAYATHLQQHLRQRPGGQHIQHHAHQHQGDGLRASVRRHRQSKPSISSHCRAPVRELVAAAATASTASAPQHHAHAPLGRCTRSARTHSQSRDPHAQRHQRCLLVALAQVAHRLARCGRMNPRQAPGLCAQVPQQPHHATQHRRQQQPPRQRASGTVAQAHALGAGDYRRPCTSPQAASTRPQAQENTSGQKLGDGGAVTANRKGSATASTASSVLRAENGIVWGLRKGRNQKTNNEAAAPGHHGAQAAPGWGS